MDEVGTFYDGCRRYWDDPGKRSALNHDSPDTSDAMLAIYPGSVDTARREERRSSSGKPPRLLTLLKRLDDDQVGPPPMAGWCVSVDPIDGQL